MAVQLRAEGMHGGEPRFIDWRECDFHEDIILGRTAASENWTRPHLLKVSGRSRLQ
jgi:hypothetical protein